MASEGISGERYLRRLVEDVLDPALPAGPDDLGVTARALVAAGAVSEDAALHLLNSAGFARRLRGEPAHPLHRILERTTISAGVIEPAVLAPRAVATGTALMDLADGRLLGAAITFGSDGACARFWGDSGEPGPRRASNVGPRPPGRSSRPTTAPAPPTWTMPRSTGGPTSGRPPRDRPLVGRLDPGLHLRDDRGGEYRLTSGGGGGGVRWEWQRMCEPTPPPDVAWFEIVAEGATPVRLTVQPARPAVSGRPHGRSDAQRWLQSEIISAVRGPRLIGPGVKALVATGLLDGGDPLIHQAELVEQAEERGGAGFDERWPGAIARRGDPAMATGAWAIAAVVELDVQTVRLDSLHADQSGTTLLGSSIPTGEPVQLTAFDDRHNWYVLHVTATSRAGGHAQEVTWRLTPELDAAARTLRIDVSGIESEAAVEVALQ